MSPTIAIGGSRRACPAHAPLKVQILSFRHTKFSKRNHLGSPRPLREILDPPLLATIILPPKSTMDAILFVIVTGKYFSYTSVAIHHCPVKKFILVAMLEFAEENHAKF